MSKKTYQSDVDFSQNPLENFEYFVNLKNELIKLGIPLEVQKIDIKDFKEWLKQFQKLNTMYSSYGDVYIEKCLEHYLSFKSLNFQRNDIFIDIAASGSQYANELYYNNHVKQTYILDLAYPEGINGVKIGANAGDTKLPDEFADKLGMHCAFECFEGDADINYIKEAGRILKKNGKFIITPLYIDKTYYNCTSEKCDQTTINFDNDALKVWRNDEWVVPFSRHYSPQSFYDRIYKNIPDNLKTKVIFYENLPEVMAIFKDQRVYCYFLLYGEKI